MIFSQYYPIVFYLILLLATVFIATLIVLRSKRRKNTIVALPDSIEPEILSMVDGVAKKFEIAKHSELKMLVRNYNTGIYVIDPSKNLDEQIKKLKEIKDNFDNFHTIVLGRLKENRKRMMRKLGSNVKFVERKEIKEVLSSLL